MSIAWPVKTRELHNHHFDSTIWNDLTFRDDDIVIATYAKSGTTWMQQIIAQLLFGGDPDLSVAEMSPWLDLRVPPKAEKLPVVEAQTHRRFLKTHLPVDALRFSPAAKYLYIGRDGRDVVWSMYNHHANANASWYAALNDTPGRVGPPIERPPADVRQYWRDWMDRDGHPFWPFWDNVRTWWAIRDLPNVRFVHFANLKRDMPGEMRRIAAFLEIPIDEARFPAIVEYCSFDWMKQHATKSVPLGGAFWDAGAEVFINKGVNGRWRDVLSAGESAEYERRAEAELGPECARWLATGEGNLPSIGEALTPVLTRVPVERHPLLVALAERVAADRYRGWAAAPANTAHAPALRACAEREIDIANRVEALFPDAAAIQREIRAVVPEFDEINRRLFAARPFAEQFEIQARGERLGAATWRAFAERETDAARRDVLLACAVLEEESALALEAILAGR